MRKAKKITDNQRLDFLQEMLDKKVYTGRVMFRWSGSGRGWRLYETSQNESVTTVREAIDKAIKDKQTSNPFCEENK